MLPLLLTFNRICLRVTKTDDTLRVKFNKNPEIEFLKVKTSKTDKSSIA